MKMKLMCLLLMLCASQMSIAQTVNSLGFKSESEYRQKTFDEVASLFKERLKSSNPTKWMAYAERRFIQKGDSTRIKYVFDPGVIKKIEIVNGPSATIENLKKGEWVLVVKPEKSTMYQAEFYYYDYRVGRVTSLPSRIEILVLEPDKYKEVEAKAKEFYEKNENGKGLSDYLRKIDPEFQKRIALPIYNGTF